MKVKTWIEISRRALASNIRTFRKIIGPKVKMWSVVKSNAYGHGLVTFSKLADSLGVDGFCVDSVVEGVKLRNGGVRKPILVLGTTLTENMSDAAANDIAITISNTAVLTAFLSAKIKPLFHLKVDTGMHRQGFYPAELSSVFRRLKAGGSRIKTNLTGIYTHFASAKDINYPTFTLRQLKAFEEAIAIAQKFGYRNLIRHVSATGGTLIGKKYHLDAVRLGIGLYGLWPSKELEVQLPGVKLEPVLAWKSVVSEMKDLKPGDYVGYDLTERITRKTKAAIVPVGYWHGLPWQLSGRGEVVVSGRRARILGRVSMDIIVIDVTGLKCNVGTVVTLIGKGIAAPDIARALQTSHYELVARLNPLIKKVIV